MNWHSISAAEALAQLNVNQKQGLTGQSAAQRQKNTEKTNWRKRNRKAFSSGF